MIYSAISSTDIARGAVDGLIPVYKQLGETPLEALNRLKLAYPSLVKVPLTYAGRLDPLAEGLLLVLSGTFNTRREEFLGLDKSYEVEVLLGASTDTGDIMGKLLCDPSAVLSTLVKPADPEFLVLSEKIVGTHEFPYPVFSSKAVRGKPLHVWAREGKLHEIEIPKTKTVIYSAKFLGSKAISSQQLETEVSSKIKLVNGDFRQADILKQWTEYLKHVSSKDFLIAKFEVNAASGAYMRTLAEHIGKLLGTPALAYSIKRVSVGDFTLRDCIDL